MTNQGDIDCFSLQTLRLSYRVVGCIPGGAAAAVSGVLSTVLTSRGEGFYLLSSSEMQRFATSEAAAVLRPSCAVLSDSNDEIDETIVGRERYLYVFIMCCIYLIYDHYGDLFNTLQ